MKSVKFIPSVCKGENPQWSGYIELRPHTFEEKFEWMEALGLSFKDDGTIETADLGKVNSIKAIRTLVKLSQKHYLSCELKHVSGAEVKSFDDAQYVEELHPVLPEVANFLMSGIKLGNG